MEDLNLTFRSPDIKDMFCKYDLIGREAVSRTLRACGIKSIEETSDAGGGSKAPDLKAGDVWHEVQVLAQWHGSEYPYECPQILGRKANQPNYCLGSETGQWWIVNAECSHAMVIPFDAEGVEVECRFKNRPKEGRKKAIRFNREDCTLVPLVASPDAA